MSTQTADATRARTGADDEDIRTHLVQCPPGKSGASAWITEASVAGLEVQALCGHRWVPSRDPRRHKMCHPCLTAAGQMLRTV